MVWALSNSVLARYTEILNDRHFFCGPAAEIFEIKAFFLAVTLARILLKSPQKGTENIPSQYRIAHGSIDAENMNFQLLLMPNSSRTGVLVKNGCNGVIQMLFSFRFALEPEK
jgi:hypothetical protein